ncbi:MAG: hypothetical protein R3E90_04635 [Marinicella sp.]
MKKRLVYLGAVIVVLITMVLVAAFKLRHLLQTFPELLSINNQLMPIIVMLVLGVSGLGYVASVMVYQAQKKDGKKLLRKQI